MTDNPVLFVLPPATGSGAIACRAGFGRRDAEASRTDLLVTYSSAIPASLIRVHPLWRSILPLSHFNNRIIETIRRRALCLWGRLRPGSSAETAKGD
jgi:hypothetical protein